MADWYVKRGAKVLGPFSGTKLKTYAQSGKLDRSDLIGKSESGPFKVAGEVKALFPEEEEEDYGFPALSGVDVNAGEAVYQSYDNYGTYDEDRYDDDEDDYYEKPKKRKKRRKRSDSTAYITQLQICGCLLAVLAGIRALLVTFSLVMLLGVIPAMMANEDFAEGFNRGGGVQLQQNQTFFTIIALFDIIMNLFAIFSGIQMARRSTYVAVWIGVVAFTVLNLFALMNPIGGCCYIPLIGFGIWGIVLLCLPDCRDEFE